MTHAALELAIDDICRTGRFDELAELFSAGGIDQIGGDPGWALERRGQMDDWPAGCEYRASVDPAEIELPEPENFYTRAEFARTVLTMLNERFAVSHELLVEVRRARTTLRATLTPLFDSLEKLSQG
jgi:hypothetical protein